MASKLHNQQGKLVHVDLSTAYNFSTKKEGVWGQWGHCLVLIRALAETLHLMTGDGIFKRTHWAKNPESQSVLIGPLLIGSLFMLCKYVKKGGGGGTCSLIPLLSTSSLWRGVWWWEHIVSLCDPILFLSIMTTACSAQPPRMQPRLLPLRRGIKRKRRKKKRKSKVGKRKEKDPSLCCKLSPPTEKFCGSNMHFCQSLRGPNVTL